MGKIIVNNDQLIKYAIDTNIFLCFGNDSKRRNTYLELLGKLVNSIDILKDGEKAITSDGKQAEGICKKSGLFEDGFHTYDIKIESLSTPDKYDWCVHEAIHEFCHSTANIMSLIYTEHENGIYKNEELRRNSFGLINTTDRISGKEVGRANYFKIFNETMMDIMTTIGINTYMNEDYNVEKILNGDDLGVASYYTRMVPLTLLFISAFSNNSNPNYSNKMKKGQGIVLDETITDKGIKLYTNDFITYSICDPLKIEEIYDKYTDEGNFKIISEIIDLYYFGIELDNDKIKNIMLNISKFISNKLSDYVKNNIISNEEAINLNNNYNCMFNKVAEYYGIKFNEKDVESLNRNTILLNDITDDGKIFKLHL